VICFVTHLILKGIVKTTYSKFAYDLIEVSYKES
jgi:hypothetical protein